LRAGGEMTPPAGPAYLPLLLCSTSICEMHLSGPVRKIDPWPVNGTSQALPARKKNFLDIHRPDK